MPGGRGKITNLVEILEYIYTYSHDNKEPPGRGDIANFLGITSEATGRKMHSIAKRGYVIESMLGPRKAYRYTLDQKGLEKIDGDPLEYQRILYGWLVDGH